jgi:hypothetical protein
MWRDVVTMGCDMMLTLLGCELFSCKVDLPFNLALCTPVFCGAWTKKCFYDWNNRPKWFRANCPFHSSLFVLYVACYMFWTLSNLQSFQGWNKTSECYLGVTIDRLHKKAQPGYTTHHLYVIVAFLRCAFTVIIAQFCILRHTKFTPSAMSIFQSYRATVPVTAYFASDRLIRKDWFMKGLLLLLLFAVTVQKILVLRWTVNCIFIVMLVVCGTIMH